jgi:hypothetical protein
VLIVCLQDGEGRDATDRHNMVGVITNEKGGNLFYPLNDTAGVQLPFATDVHNKIAWIGQTVRLEKTKKKKEMICCSIMTYWMYLK